MTRENTTNRDPGRLQEGCFVGPRPFEIDPLPDFHQRRYLEYLWCQSQAKPVAAKGINHHVVAINPLDGIGDSRGENRSRSATNGTDHRPDIGRVHQRSRRVVDGHHLGARLRSIENARAHRVLAPITAADKPCL